MLGSMQIPVGGEVFDARVAGPESGELVLLLHGFPQTSLCWRAQLEVLGAAGYRAVAPDQRGYSPGARPDDLERYRMDRLVADVLAIADELGGHTFHLVGHDWGAAVAWQVAGRHPGRLRSFTSLSVPHPFAMTKALQGSDQASRSAYMADLADPATPDRLLADGAAGLRAIYAESGFPGDPTPYVEALTEPGALAAACRWYAAADRRMLDGMGPVSVPTLFVWSTEDTALGREGAELTAGYVEGPYRFEVLEGVSHWIQEEAPERLEPMLLEHLAAPRP